MTTPYQEAVEQFGKNSIEAISLSGDEDKVNKRLKYHRRRLAYWQHELERMEFVTYKGAAEYVDECEKMRNREVWNVETLEEALDDDAWLR